MNIHEQMISIILTYEPNVPIYEWDNMQCIYIHHFTNSLVILRTSPNKLLEHCKKRHTAAHNSKWHPTYPNFAQEREREIL